MIHVKRGDVSPLKDWEGGLLRVLTGEVWLTEKGNPADLVLGPGSIYRVPPGKSVVLESLADVSSFVFVTTERTNEWPNPKAPSRCA